MISYHTCPLASEEGKETGGMNVYVYELSKNLARLGHSVDIITRSQGEDNKPVVQIEKNVRLMHVIAGPQQPIPKKKITDYIPQFIQAYEQYMEKERLQYDILDAHYYQSGLIGLELQKKLHIPMVMTFHTLALMKNLVARSGSEMETQMRINAEFLLAEHADAIITPSASDKQYLKYLYGVDTEKIFEVPPGVNTTLFHPIPKNEAKKEVNIIQSEKILLFVGRIEPLKGIDTLLYAIKILITQLPDLPVKLLIVGGDISQHITKWSKEMQQLQTLTQTLNISQYVQFVGKKPQPTLPYYYNAAEILVMPSHYESFGMTAAEAMACGTPVITTNVAGVSQLIDDYHASQITSVNNPLLLAFQIKNLLTNPELYTEIRNKSINDVEDLRWSHVAKKVEALYARII